MQLEEITGPITQLAVAWSEGDRGAGDILFSKVLMCFEPRARSIALRCDDQRTIDVLNAAYVEISKSEPRVFENRARFFGLYLNAMKFWLNDYVKRWRAQKRSAPMTSDLSTAASPDAGPLISLIMDMNSALERLVNGKRIVESEAELFISNKVLGVSQGDLANLHGLKRDKVGAIIRFVKVLLRKELREYAPS